MPMCVRGGRESINNQYFLVIVLQPISLCILQKHANQSAWFIFPHLVSHSWCNAASILQFVRCGHAKAES